MRGLRRMGASDFSLMRGPAGALGLRRCEAGCPDCPDILVTISGFVSAGCCHTAGGATREFRIISGGANGAHLLHLVDCSAAIEIPCELDLYAGGFGDPPACPTFERHFTYVVLSLVLCSAGVILSICDSRGCLGGFGAVAYAFGEPCVPRSLVSAFACTPPNPAFDLPCGGAYWYQAGHFVFSATIEVV